MSRADSTLSAAPLYFIRVLTRIETPTSFTAIRKPRPGVRQAVTMWLRAALRRHRSRVLLATMDDTILRDIGLTRSEAMTEAEKPFWRP